MATPAEHRENGPGCCEMNEMNAGIKNSAQGQERIHLLIKAPYVTGQGHQHHLSWKMNHERLYWCFFNALHTYSMEMVEWVSNWLLFLFFLTNVSSASPSLPLFFSTERSHLLLCGPFVPLVLFKGKTSDCFFFFLALFYFPPPLSRLSVQFHPLQKIILYQIFTCIIT